MRGLFWMRVIMWVCGESGWESRNQGGNARNRGENAGNRIEIEKKWNRKKSRIKIAKVADKVANMFCCRKPEIKVLIKSVQQQINYVDCGVFAIAFVTSLGFGDRPDSKIVRQHRFTVQHGNTIQRWKRKPLVIEGVSSCRKPYYLVMVICTKCRYCFHVDCESPKSATDNEDNDFFCTGCKWNL